MSFIRPGSNMIRQSQGLRAVRLASTSTSASRTTSNTPVARKAYNSGTVRKTPVSPQSSLSPAAKPAAAAPTAKFSASDPVDATPPPPPPFDDLPPEPAPRSTPASRSTSVKPSSSSDPTKGPPPPLTGFPDENYESLPDALGSAPVDQGGDWSTSFAGLSFEPFPPETAKVLMRDLDEAEVCVKPDGVLYMPEIRYRKRLNEAFGPGGWGMAPRGATHITLNQVSREWGLICLGRLVAVSRGESDYFKPEGITTAHESTKSNALMRCCKDLGIAWELWDPTWTRAFIKKHCVDVFVANKFTGNKKKMTRRKTDPKFPGEP